MLIIKGAPGGPNGKWDEVQAIQDQPFIYIHSNGSKWAGEEPDDVKDLLDALGKYTLDPSFEHYGNFLTINPCEGVRDPENHGQWIDGPRLYRVEPVWHFFGNFFDVSHGFTIDTNDRETAVALIQAIDANQQTDAYRNTKAEREEQRRTGRRIM